MDAIKLPFTFDVEQVIKEIESFPKDQFYNIHNPYVNIDQLYSIHLIEPEITDSIDEKINFVPNETLKEKAYLNEILSTFKCDKETFRVHKLISGGHIRQHRDIGKNYENGNFRLHIPIQTDENVFTELDGKPITMQAGECWYLNFHLPHEIKNNSKKERIHLIIDCKVNDWWHDMFKPYQNSEQPSIYSGMSLNELESMKHGLEEMDNEASIQILGEITKEIEERK